LRPVETELIRIIDERKRAEEEEASRSILREVTKALLEAFLMLPREEYGWLDARQRASDGKGRSTDMGASSGGAEGNGGDESADGFVLDEDNAEKGDQRSFFEYPGPLYRLLISPRSARVLVGESTKLHAIARDKSKRVIDSGVDFEWELLEGAGSIAPSNGEFVDYSASSEPQVVLVEATARQGEVVLTAQATITVAAELLARQGGDEVAFKNGLPGYTYRRAAGEPWRSRYEIPESLIVINNGHADFIFASRLESTKLRYIARLYAKEIVLANFPGASSEELLERMVELTLYVEDNLR